ncbi:type II toxin-antitoxin system PemK/MazF family toxin [Rhizobium sp. 2MFCol3.1]|jgi:mRNA interferase MazF|uniref:type II toxin-antitoxin system PemK/MazF family toxin n=1 Tax=Rhizobium sp. 2MFCol3.1 TaxID=1246459 RepID=UPI000369642B|nr:type II toxin-antitoxin system PemK/MazF family toxin [Rhizobium sp. 2MFCol3.1]
MRRGDVVVVAIQGDYGKPRPAVVVQTDALSQDYPSAVVCPITSTIIDLKFRPVLEASQGTGLRIRSQIMTDKIIGVPREKVGKIIGQLAESEMRELDAALSFLLGLVD